MIRKLILLLACIVYVVYPNLARADSNFTTDYYVTYTVGENQMTHVAFAITLTNTSSNKIASSYAMQLGFNEINNLKVADSYGQIMPKIVKTKEGYTIQLWFNHKATGLGTKQVITVSFDTPNVSRKYGKILEINIPGIARPDDFSSFTVAVKTPHSFGNPSYVKPAPRGQDLIFTKEQLGKSGISLTFGKEQLYAFNLKYHLYNNIFWSQQTIALPPKTNYQDVAITSIEPKPSTITKDADGNLIAQYQIPWFHTNIVTVHGVARIHLQPKKEVLSQSDWQKYTAAKKYWEADNSEIQKLAKQLRNPQAINDYVVKTLSYDFSRVTSNKPRLGAMGVLDNPKSAACREFTDLFIALSRAAGIPAREVDGYAYTENPQQRPVSLTRDILHAWPEYYDNQKKTWVMIDPTWGNTTGGIDYFSTLDLDHVAFVIKGNDSSYPLPAGGYKANKDQQEKDVTITFADEFPQTIIKP